MSAARLPSQLGALAAIRQFSRQRTLAERCDLCSAALAPAHQHVLELASRRLLCACDACALLFSGQQGTIYRRVPLCVRFLPDFQMTDAQWDALLIPINLAFLYSSTQAGRVVAHYPSPAGVTEALLDLDAWQELARNNPILETLEPDVEALLVNRVHDAQEYYLAPIDQCYKLVGLIRTHWRGLSGGAEVWEAIGGFFAELQERSIEPRTKHQEPGS